MYKTIHTKLICIAVFLSISLFPFLLADSPVSDADTSGSDLSFIDLDSAVRELHEAESIEETITQLSNLAETDMEKARAVYIWMTSNIAYDASAYFSGRRAVTNPGGVFRTGKSVCQGYAELFNSLARGLGLDSRLISGYAKGYGYRDRSRFSRTNHAWNAVLVDGSWRLMDSTWGAGHVSNRSFVWDFSAFWFDCSPELFLWTHLPKEEEWQLTAEPISMTDYVVRKYYKSFFFESLYALGVEEAVMEASLSQGMGIPESYDQYDAEIEIVNAPIQKTLQSGEEIEFQLRVPGVDQAAFVGNNKSFSYLKKNGDIFSGTITPQRGTLKISVYIEYKGRRSYWPVLSYSVN